MRVHKVTPFEFSLMPWELEPPKTSLMLVVKATFDLVHDGVCSIAETQVPCLGEVPWEDGDPPSLRTESDYAVFKPRGEWYLSGHAHVVGSRPTTVLSVEARVGAQRKRLTVWGDRTWKRGVLGAVPSEPEPFTRMPLRWERSFGGAQVPENPVGRGSDKRDDGAMLPNLEDPARPVLSRDDRPSPVGLFAIPAAWRARSRLTGTYDDVWKASRWPYFPRDFRLEFFQAAPPDQRLERGYWDGDEVIELVGLHPQVHRLRTRLPGLHARAFIERVSRPPGSPRLDLLERAELEAMGRPRLKEVELRLDTIVIDSDAGQVLCTFRGLAEVSDSQLSDVERLFILHEPGAETHPIQHYEELLLREVLREAAEFELDADADDAAPELTDGAEPQADAEAALPDAERAKHLADLRANLPVALAGFQEPSGAPTPEEYRSRLQEAGVDADAILPPLEDVEPPPELAEAPSLLRLAAIIRRRLRKPFRELDLTAMPYRGLDLSGVDFTGAVLTDADLTRCKLVGSTFDGALLDRAKLIGADARESSFQGADLTEVDATQARFDRSNLDGAVGSHAVFTRATFFQCSMADVELEAAAMEVCDLREAKLDGADFTGANIEGAGFVSSSMLDTSLESVRAAGAVFDRCRMPDLRASDGADFTRARFILVDAPRAQFQGTALTEANFSGSNLEEADFSDAKLARSNFVRASAPKAKFDRADVREATLMSANLFEASFQEAKLSNADLRGAHVFSANLYRTEMHGTLFEGANVARTLRERR